MNHRVLVWAEHYLRPVPMAACVLILTLSWAIWSLDRTAKREIVASRAEIRAGILADSQQIKAVLAVHNQKLSGIEDQATALLANGNALIARVNDKNPKLNTVALLNEDLVRARDLIGHADLAANDARKASDEELKALPGLTAQAHSTIAGFEDDETQAKELLIDLQASAIDLNKQIDNKNIAAIETNMASMTGSGAKVGSDFADETHKLVHPNKKKLTFFGAIDSATMWWHTHNPLPSIF